MTSGYHNRHFTSVIMHYDGSHWTLSSVPDQSGLRDVKALSPTDAWALAADGSVLNWNGVSWSVQTQEPGATVLTALSPTDVWVGGVVSLGHYNGSTWSTTPTPKLCPRPERRHDVGSRPRLVRRRRGRVQRRRGPGRALSTSNG